MEINNQLKSTLFILIALLISNVPAREKLDLKVYKSLAIKPQDVINRTVNRKNYLEYLLVTEKFNSPNEGDKLFGSNDTKSKWERISKNEHGWYESPNLRGGYAYLEIFSEIEQNIILEGSAYSMVYINGEPRSGNVYQYKDKWEAWEPDFGFSFLPVKLKKGKNEFIFKCYYGRFKVNFYKPDSKYELNIKDLTMPDIRVGEKINHFGGVIVINNTSNSKNDLVIETTGKGLEKTITEVPIIQDLSTRKVKFDFVGDPIYEKSNLKIIVKLIDRNTSYIYDSKEIDVRVLDLNETYKQTFISNIDNSVQFYAVNPKRGNKNSNALFFSLHGAAVNADNQANSYYSKNWGTIISPTNRRPYGFNWEDWGRLDALEVFDIALNKFDIDENRIYLTGHSMGGHGTWHIGGTFPDKFAAIGPSAGWISFWSYRFNDKYSLNNKVIRLINRTGNPSDTYKLINNYDQLGVYIIHGADDDNVRAEQSHSIIKELEKNHKDFVYHEEPNAGHWWDKSDERGADCVDWAPLFDFFARHTRPEKNRKLLIDFTTASPGVSAKNNWLTIYRQQKFFEFSRAILKLDPGIQRISGTTENIEILSIDTDILDPNRSLTVILDEQKIENLSISKSRSIWFKNTNGQWKLVDKPSVNNKNPNRYGSFKDSFRNKMVFVFGTKGNNKENQWAKAKAKYDAEYFWYQGNGSVEVIADTQYNHYKYFDRNIILYGNLETNSIWKETLSDAPISVTRKAVSIGDEVFEGDNLSCLFVYPKKDNVKNMIAVVSGTGIEGQRLTNTLPYMSPGFTYPDVTVISTDILLKNTKGYLAAGFWGSDWTYKNGEFEYIK